MFEEYSGTLGHMFLLCNKISQTIKLNQLVRESGLKGTEKTVVVGLNPRESHN